MNTNKLLNEEKIDLVKWYFEVKKDNEVKNKYNYIKEKYEQKYYPKVSPSKPLVLNCVKNFNEYGSIVNRQKGTPHKKTVITEENIEKVKNCLITGLGKSIRDIGLKTDIKKESVRTILKNELKLYPYKVQVVQQIYENNIKKRLEFCKTMIQKLENDPQLLNRIWFTDESHFHKDGHCNKQNYRIWGTEKPETFIEKPAHPEYVTVWCAISAQGPIGPYFFEDSNGTRVTVDQFTYQDMIENYFVPKLREKCGESFNEQIFHQDGATPHTAGLTIELLHKHFGNNIISFRSKDIWPPTSPDLNPCDYYLWSFLKDKIFTEKIANCEILKEKIEDLCNTEVTEEICKKVINNLHFRLRYCIMKNGKHFANMLKKPRLPLTTLNTNTL